MKKNILIGVIVGLCAALVVNGIGYLLYGWNPGHVEQQKYSNGVGGFWGWPSLLAGAVVLLFLIKSPIESFVASVAAIQVPMYIAIFYECYLNATSHNLIPFELIVLMLGSIVLHLPAFIIAKLRGSASVDTTQVG